MNLHAYRADQVRALEELIMAVEGPDVLMQRAAAGLATSALDLLRRTRGSVYGARVVILAGTGNNAGDALHAGARLARRGVRVTAVLGLGRTHEAGLAALLDAGGVLRSAEDAGLVDLGAVPRPPIDLFVDAMLGIGGRAGLSGPLEGLAMATGRWSIPVLAVDLPSGVGTDSGAVPGTAVQATRTVTFGVLKPCHLIEPARSRCGEVELVDIGLDEADADELPTLRGCSYDDLAQAWPYPAADGDKYARGVVGVDTGSDTYPGAAVMSTYGAVYAGAGMVRFLGSDRPAQIIGAQLPSVVFSPGRVQANLFGSGWGDKADGQDTLLRAADEGLPAVVDADGLRYLPDACPASWLLTPHAGELARLLDVPRGEVEADPLRAVRAGAEQTGATVLLKGATQLVARPGRDLVLVARPGPSWTAQAGSGDVLGGVCAALLAAGVAPQLAGQLGASVQAAATEAHPGAVPPQELARSIGSLLGDLQRRRDELMRSLVTPGIDPGTARADIDLGALRANLRVLAAHAAPARLMLVVKADAYGHGMLRCAAAAREEGVPWLGVATPAEALALREAGDVGRVLAWLYGVEEDLAPLVAADVDLSVQSADQVSRAVAASAVTERRARLHLKVDTGLSRNGAPAADWAELFAAAVEAEQVGAVEVVALWSHLAAADEPGHPATALQVAAFEQARAEAAAAGLHPELRHLANSAGAMVLPESRYDLVRVGVAAYGVEPAPGLADAAGIALRPVMSLRATLANVKQVEAGAGVSYGWAWTAPSPTTVGLVPLGYADGVPRHAGNRAQVSVAGMRAPVRGRICMDQFVVELGPGVRLEPGAEVVLFGSGDAGEPTAADWAGWCDTIGYEIVTRIGPRVPRRYLDRDQRE